MKVSFSIGSADNCTMVDVIREDSTQLGAISFWVLFVIFFCFCVYAAYATWFVLIKKKIGEESH
jgi:hypothetical protein